MSSSPPLSEPSSEPSGGAGEDTARCGCGADRHPEHEDRCAAGHVLPGNTTAMVTGSRSVAFWREHAQAKRQLRDSILADQGHDAEDAPEALLLAAESAAQAAIIRDSAYMRLSECGGPMTDSGRTRRVFAVWVKAMDRLEKHLRMVGLERKARPVPSLEEELRRRNNGGQT